MTDEPARTATKKALWAAEKAGVPPFLRSKLEAASLEIAR